MTDDDMPSSIVQLPFHNRWDRSVISDEVYVSREPDPAAAERAMEEQGGSSIWPAISLIAPALVPGGLLVRGVLLAGGMAYTAYATRSDSGDKTDVKSYYQDLIVKVPVLDTANFDFLTSYAEVGRVYAANPLSTLTCYPVYSYNDDMIIHKLSELELIPCAQGVKSLAIKYHEDHMDEATGKVASSTLPVGVEAPQTSDRTRRFERSGTSEGREPSLPAPSVWEGAVRVLG